MRIVYAKEADRLSRYAADLIKEQLGEKPDSVLGLATGSTPLPLYKYLISDFQEGFLSFADATSFNLDEYVGLPGDHPASYRYFMEENLFSHVNFSPGVNAVPSGVAEDFEKEAAAYEEAIKKAGGIDLQILGIGGNGHIGFNEPADTFEPLTHVVKLDEATRADNARFFEKLEDVPKYAISMGVGTILWAGKILLLAFGEGKAKAIEALVKGKVDPHVPASILQLHRDVTILVDEGAASLLQEDDYEFL